MALVWQWLARAAGLQAWEDVAPSVHKRLSGRSCSTRDMLSRSFGGPNAGGLRLYLSPPEDPALQGWG
jgi:hypothetical protein